MPTWYQPRPFLTVAVHARREPRLLRALLGPPVSPRAAAITLRLTRCPAAASTPGAGATLARGAYKGIPWHCRVERRAPEDWLLEFTSPVFRPYLSFHIALLPAIRAVLGHRGEAVVAGAAFGCGDEATLLLGTTGAGKTGALLAAVERGFTPIADEYFSVNASGTAHPLLSVLALRSNVHLQAPSVYRALSRRKRLLLAWCRALQRATRNRLQPLVHLSLEQLGGAATRHRGWKIGAVWWLEQGAGAAAARTLSAPELGRRVAAHLTFHDRAYGNPVLRVAPEAYEGDAATLRKAFEAAQCYIGSPAAALSRAGEPVRGGPGSEA